MLLLLLLLLLFFFFFFFSFLSFHPSLKLFLFLFDSHLWRVYSLWAETRSVFVLRTRTVFCRERNLLIFLSTKNWLLCAVVVADRIIQRFFIMILTVHSIKLAFVFYFLSWVWHYFSFLKLIILHFLAKTERYQKRLLKPLNHHKMFWRSIRIIKKIFSE